MGRRITLFLSVVACALSTGLQAQNVTIPDANFKAALVANSAINTNMDAEVQVSEALAFTGTVDVSSLNISSLIGIESFTNITTLYCYGNQLATLDVSSNTSLVTLACNSNQLTTLDISSNTALTLLQCFDNQITDLNLQNNTGLTTLYAYDNQLVSLNIKNGNNINITNADFYVINNPNLTCIEVPCS